ncbi:MAG TPA: metallophosphoesterase family protein [Gaiellaceae bacterium]|nr:metallophosphoesterase family protein [Gaiellaceae bacterium]
MKVAALYDIHGNLPALDAVLADVERERFDLVLVGGDVFWGPCPAGTLARVRSLSLRTLFVRGNCERETFARDPADTYATANAWVASKLTADDEEFVASWPLTVQLEITGVGEVRFCHATPRSDTEIITARTPEVVLADAVGGTGAAVVVCGHTHVQFDLAVSHARILNAGSVGWGYEGKPGAYWLELGPSIRHRRTEYDYEATAAAVTETGWTGPFGASDLLEPASPDEAIKAFETQRTSMAETGI